MIQVGSIDELQEAVRGHPRIRVAAGSSKPALAAGANLSLSGLSGVVQYQPTEYTFTALAGTPLAEIDEMLAGHGQYLPFDPPLVEAGATLGGTVAAGLSGPGRFRYGGIRDFLIGVRLVNGEAQLVRGGGLVVKNAAGFDIPKLMVGSLGRWGVLAELTFKVFPAAEAAVTLHIDLAGAESAVAVMNQLAGSAEQLDCLDFQPPGRVTVRIRGTRPALPARVQRLRRLVSPEAQVQQIDEDQGYWRDVREFAWVGPQQTLVKVPLAPPQILKMEGKLARIAGDVPRRYSAGGNVAWIAWPTEAGRDELEGLLAQLDSRGLILRGRGPAVLVPEDRSSAFAERLLSVFDPAGKFER